MLAVPAEAITRLDPLDAPEVSLADYVALGAQFPSVGEVRTGLSGSGVLIASDWVLTAAHLAAFGNVSGFSFRIDGGSYAVAERFILPGFDNATQTNDLALLRLVDPVAGVAPAQLWGFGVAEDLLGEVGAWVGWGLTGTGRTGFNAPAPGRLAMTNRIDGFGGDFGLAASAFVSDFDSPGGGHNSLGVETEPTRLEGAVAPGDSGGGVFVAAGGDYYLAGTIAFSARFNGSPNSGYGDISGATALVLFEDWITATSGVTFVPEPRLAGVVAGLAVLLLLLVRRCRPGSRRG